jgi:hypothetical protein
MRLKGDVKPMEKGVVHHKIPKSTIFPLRALVARALNANQILILKNIDGQSSITATVKHISNTRGIAVSTLKLNSRILKQLKLLETGDSNKHHVKLTNSGRLVIKILGETDVQNK